MLLEKGAQKPDFMRSLLYNMGLIGLLGAGAGAAGRGAQGLYNLGRRSFTRRPPGAFTAPTFQIGKPKKEEEEEEEKVAAASPVTPAPWWESTFPKWVHSPLQAAKGTVSKTFTPTTWKGHPLAIPGMLAAGAGGLYGGYKLLDWIMDRRREGELKDELARASKEYEEALAGQFGKTSEINKDLNYLCDLIEQHGVTKQAADMPGQIVGALLALGGGAGLLSGMVAYNMARKRTPGALTQEALRRHRRVVGLGQPAPLYATPAPLRLNQPARSAADEDELQGEPLDRDVA